MYYCCCIANDCGDNYIEYSNPCYSMYFTPNLGIYGEAGELVFVPNVRFLFMERPLTPIVLDGYSFLPNRYVSPQDDRDFGGLQQVLYTGIPDYAPVGEDTTPKYEALAEAINNHQNALISGFLSAHPDSVYDLQDYNMTSQIDFEVAGRLYKKTVNVCVKDQKIENNRYVSPDHFYLANGQDGHGIAPFYLPRLDVMYTCKYAIKITIEEIK